jgi:hypothetical protein
MPDINEDLDSLLAGFLDAEEARRAAADIRSGDRLLSELAAPRPGAGLLADINGKVAAALVAQRRRVRHRIGRAVAAAAAVIVVGSVLLFFSGDAPDQIARPPLPPDRPLAPRWWDDSAVETLAAEVDDVLDSMISISVDDAHIEDQIPDFDLAELEELEMIAMNDDFWKG